MDTQTDYLPCSMGQAAATGLSRLHGRGVSHGQVTRLTHAAALTDRALWPASKPLIRRAEATRPADDFAVRVVDDSILEKTRADANALIRAHWDHCGRRFVRGLNFVPLSYEASGVALPIATGLIRKTEPATVARTLKAKHVCKFAQNEHPCAPPNRARRPVARRCQPTDNWCAAVDNPRHVRALGHHHAKTLKRTHAAVPDETAR